MPSRRRGCKNGRDLNRTSFYQIMTLAKIRHLHDSNLPPASCATTVVAASYIIPDSEAKVNRNLFRFQRFWKKVAGRAKVPGPPPPTAYFTAGVLTNCVRTGTFCAGTSPPFTAGITAETFGPFCETTCPFRFESSSARSCALYMTS